MDFDLQYPPPRVDAEVLKSSFRRTAGDNYFGNVAEVNMMSIFLGASDTEVWEESEEEFQDVESVMESVMALVMTSVMASVMQSTASSMTASSMSP